MPGTVMPPPACAAPPTAAFSASGFPTSALPATAFTTADLPTGTLSAAVLTPLVSGAASCRAAHRGVTAG
ncbi:hypothetical protein [Streptomyces sp. XD-27]|uniref:hypothetical protein n=1 Tax=Streptomyces sp. XD-27 TaxID=3062779 RepID=UPI0026F46C92|nr:hypothetical protein [Streptomyces sp. XD-27]WKX69678.1 hypothetical protein Q3Y56_06940 [Streptomyces sp. XD-27]